MNADTIVQIAWNTPPASGRIRVPRGALSKLEAVRGGARCMGDCFETQGGPVRLRAVIAAASLSRGAYATRVTVEAGERSFTFFLRDVDARSPILIREYGVVVTTGDDARGYDEIDADLRGRGLRSVAEEIDAEPEETGEAACAANRDQNSPVWLGLGRDMRLFSLTYDRRAGYWGQVWPRYHSVAQTYPEAEGKPVGIGFALGRGASCSVDIRKRLDQGVLPIVHAEQRDGAIVYQMTAFASLESGPLTANGVAGTDAQLVYANTGGCMLSDEERERFGRELDALKQGEEETVCVVRCRAENTDPVPRYAWFKAGHSAGWHGAQAVSFDGERGFTRWGERVFAVNRLDGAPMPQAEMAILLQPGESVTMDLFIPHQALPAERAERLAGLDFDAHLAAARAYWKAKLSMGAQVSVPEAAIDERVRAGLLHLDIAACGAEPDGSLAATIGWYAPIGSESSPIIQFLDSMGRHDLARRALQFFLDRQRPDGFIQNFGGYQLETGPVLWSLGEHYRYTHDNAWVNSVKENVLRACEYLLNWRERNKRPELRGRGYGLLDGKVADPEDFFHSFMLNGLSCVGIARAAEMLAEVDPAEAERLRQEAAAFREDIRTAYLESMAASPVIPVGDGSWIPSFAPWAEYPGPVALFAEGGEWFSHGTVACRDSVIGATYLALGEIFDCREPAMDFLLRAHQELFTLRNAAFSQPYYSRHDFMHLMRGEAAQFLKTYYNQVTALQDRQTYSFWEHYYEVSEHKTHEEGWFLMQSRWMLWHEQGATLHLLRGIPRRWLADGETIRLTRCASHFGPFDLDVASHVAEDRITARIRLDPGRMPEEIVLRLPHPDGRRAVRAEGGVYDPATESIRFALAAASTHDIVLYF